MIGSSPPPGGKELASRAAQAHDARNQQGHADAFHRQTREEGAHAATRQLHRGNHDDEDSDDIQKNPDNEEEHGEARDMRRTPARLEVRGTDDASRFAVVVEVETRMVVGGSFRVVSD